MSKTATRSALKNAIQAASLQGQISELAEAVKALTANGHSVAQTTVAEVVKRPVGRPKGSKNATTNGIPVITMRYVPRNGKQTEHDLFEATDGALGKLYLPIGTTSVTIKLVRS